MMFVALLLAAAAPVAAPEVHRLSPDAAEAAVQAGAERNRAAELLAADDAADAAAAGDPDTRRKIHGEVGFGVGTGGGREAFGTAVVPLGQTGTAAFSYDYSRWGDDRRRQRNR